MNGYINDQNLVEKVETWLDNAMLGDMLFDARYSEYKDFGGVKFPMKIVQTQGGHPIFDLTVYDVKPNAPVTIQAPAGPRRRARGGGAGRRGTPGTPSEKLADGVYLILGGYASLAVDFKDYIVVIEGPQSEERASAIIAEAKRLIPGKPIRYVVNTHHHIDHSSGLRTFVAEGATVVTHEINKPYFEKIFSAPHTLNPDKLAQSKRKPTFETVADEEGADRRQPRHRAASPPGQRAQRGAARGLPAEGENSRRGGCLQSAGPGQCAGSVSGQSVHRQPRREYRRLKLDVETIIPVHYAADGRKVTRAELMRFVTAGTN